MGIFDKQQDKAKKFKKVTEGKTKEEIRVAEEHLLKPENIPDYTGASPKHKSELASRTALIVFKNKAEQELISEIFSVRTSVNGETYITDISLLNAISHGVRSDLYRIVDNEIQLNAEDSVSSRQFTTEDVDSLPKKMRKWYKKICVELDTEVEPEPEHEKCEDCTCGTDEHPTCVKRAKRALV